jgi:hypothetical protein
MRLKITNNTDELGGGARIVDADTGDMVVGVIEATLTMTPGETKAHFTVLNPEVDIVLQEGEIKIESTE